MENVNLVPDMDQAYDESIEKIFELLEEKKYFHCRDELLKHNEVEIAEMLVDIRREFDLQRMVVLFRALPKDISVDVFAELSIDDQSDGATACSAPSRPPSSPTSTGRWTPSSAP